MSPPIHHDGRSTVPTQPGSTANVYQIRRLSLLVDSLVERATSQAERISVLQEEVEHLQARGWARDVLVALAVGATAAAVGLTMGSLAVLTLYP